MSADIDRHYLPGPTRGGGGACGTSCDAVELKKRESQNVEDDVASTIMICQSLPGEPGAGAGTAAGAWRSSCPPDRRRTAVWAAAAGSQAAAAAGAGAPDAAAVASASSSSPPRYPRNPNYPCYLHCPSPLYQGPRK